ncbi:hypothetical protein ISCU110981_05375 [Isoptericola cucumis]
MDTMNTIVTANAAINAAPGYKSALGVAVTALVPFRVRQHAGTGNADLHIAPDSAPWSHPV